MSPSVVATSSAAAFWGPNLCSKASSCNFHMIHIRLVQNSWTPEKAGSFTLALAALAWTNSFVDVENVLASENHLEIVDLPHLWHDRDPSGSPPDWIRLGRWSCLMIKSSLWNFVPPGDIVLGEKPIVITTGHLIILILIYSDHHKPPWCSSENSIRRHMSPHSPSTIHDDRSPVRDNHRRWCDVFFHGDDPARTATIPPINSSTLPGLDEFPLNLYQMIRVELVPSVPSHVSCLKSLYVFGLNHLQRSFCWVKSG